MIEKVLLQELESLPQMILRQLLTRKLESAGVEIPTETLDDLVKHLLDGKKDSFFCDDCPETGDKEIVLSFTKEDEKQIEVMYQKALEAIPEATRVAVEKTSEQIFNSLRRKWKEQSLFQEYELQDFRDGLEDRWGKGLDYLRMLLTACREVGEDTLKRHNKSKSKRHALRRWVLVRLHARSCQVADEIICLIENGFAEGAMARWRTLHEISVVATLISDGDEDLAERYILHDAVEVKRQADEYEETQIPLGGDRISKRERKLIDDEYAEVLCSYGPQFSHPYGWSAKHLNLKKPTFKNLQEAAYRKGMNSYYKLASFSVHASSRNLFFNLSSIDNEEILLAGRSNAGFLEPGVRTAYTLTLTTSLYVGETTNLDRLCLLGTIIRIRDAIGPAFQRSAARLLADERRLRRVKPR